MILKKYKNKRKRVNQHVHYTWEIAKKKKKATTLINKERVNGQFHVKPILSPLFSIVFFLIPNWGKQCFLLKWWAQRENSHNPFPPPPPNKTPFSPIFSLPLYFHPQPNGPLLIFLLLKLRLLMSKTTIT